VYEFFSEYGLFFAKTLTLAIIFVGSILLLIVAAAQSKRKSGDGEFEIEHLNEKLSETTKSVKEVIFDKHAFEQELKAEKKAEKAKKKAAKNSASKNNAEEADTEAARKRVFVLDFDGDIRASDVESLRETITAVMTIARPDIDEVVLKLESGGGRVHSYGFAASQLKRITNKNIALRVCVVAVDARGG